MQLFTQEYLTEQIFSINAFSVKHDNTVAYQTLLDANMPTAGVERQDSFKSVLRDVKRKLSTTERKNSKQENIKSSNSPFSSLKSTPFTSAHASPNRSPFNPNQLSPGQKCPGDNFFFNALFVSEHFKHFEIYLFLTHFGG